jgi:geranylgeranyl diphosphate synthase type I
MLESMLRNDLSIDLALCLEVIRGKTAALMRAACESGGLLAGAAPAQVQVLGRYGEALGMAFQIRDDLLPYTSDTRTIGKAITSDANNRYPHLPILLAQSLAGDADRRRLQELFSSTEDPPAVHRELRELLLRTGAIEEATRLAREHAACARAALRELPPSESRDRLAALVTTVVDRDH